MDNPRLSSPPSIRVHELSRTNHPYGSQHASSRTSYSSSNASRPSNTSSAMPIAMPNSRRGADSPPPPLPPPRHIEDLDAGQDRGWQWGNIRSGLVNSDTELRTNWETNWDKRKGMESSGHLNSRRRDSSISTVRQQSDYDGYDHRDEGYHSLSGTSIIHQLQGERPLEQRSRQDSSHAYDQRLLSSFGKAKTPPRGSISGSIDASPVSAGRTFQFGKQPQPLKSLSISDQSLSTSSDSPFKVGSPFSSKWVNSPQSAVVSPSLISAATSAKNFMEYRSPTYDSIPTPSSVTDSERYAHLRRGPRRSDSSASIVGGFDEGPTRFKRGGSYEQGIFTSEPDNDSDFPMEETGGMRQLHLDDTTSPGIDVYSPKNKSRLGMKRRASSPPPESSHDDKALQPSVGGPSSELYQRRTSGHLSANRTSPVHPYQPLHGSASTASSTELRNGSYTSSTLSVGGTSNTSLSSHERLSPGGISPLADQHDGHNSPYVNSQDSNTRASLSLPHQSIPPDAKTIVTLPRKMSNDLAGRGKQQNAQKLQSNVHICDCCPKKPKKFDSLEELRQHQSEKQYSCSYCHNRFKNKNEAERHQNSLHLRRHSWSCATLERNYEAAFHPCTAIPPNTNANHAPPPQPGTLAAYDVCGYCGDEFPNFPTQDWVARGNHLTNTHKFGECNQSKKFFRADHFRQHLKHSHAGTSGKWTNMLENACMKDEPPLTPEAQSQEAQRQQQQMQGAPVAHMGGVMGMGGGSGMRQGSYGGMGMGMPGGPDSQHPRIDEEKFEDM